MKVIGLIGEKGAGKQTFCNLLAGIAEGLHVERIGSGDILLKSLEPWKNIPPSRKNLQKLAIMMKTGFGEDAITNAMYFLIKEAESYSDVVIFDGVRWDSDVAMIHRFPHTLFVYITANIKTRYERTKLRNQKRGEAEATLEQFIREEGEETEVYIPCLAARAQVRINNDNSLEELRQSVNIFFDTHIKNGAL